MNPPNIVGVSEERGYGEMVNGAMLLDIMMGGDGHSRRELACNVHGGV